MAVVLDVIYRVYPFALIAFGVTLAGTAMAIRVARRLGVMDMPDATLKPHARPTPYLGGTAICLGWAIALIAAMASGTVTEWNLMAPLLIGGVLVSLIGLVDDLREIPPKLRLTMTTLVVVVVLSYTHISDRLIDSIFLPAGIALPHWLSVGASYFVGVFIVLGACNSANLIDGLDGLCSGVTAIVALGFCVLAGHLAVWDYSQSGDPVRLVMAIAMFGAALGFLPLNFNPAKIFMGDAGSILLGYNCGVMILLFAERGIFKWVLGGLMVFALPITDTALAMFRRWRSGRSIFAGDRSHFYDQLVDRGLSVRQVVAISYLVAGMYAVMGCLVMVVRTRFIIPLYIVVALVTMAVLKIAHMTEAESFPKKKQPRERLDILFTSVGRRVALARQFARAARDIDIDLRIHTADCQAMAPGMQVADASVLVPAVSDPGYVETLLDYCRQYHIKAVIPLIDPELQCLADARDRFADIGTMAMISSPEVVGISRNKVRTHEFLRQHGFASPHIFSDEELAKPRFPLFIKPLDGSSSLGAHKIRDERDLAYYRAINPDSIVQAFIDGVEYTTDVFVDFHGRPRCCVPRRRHEVRGGEVSKGQAIRHEQMMAEHVRLIETLGDCRGMMTIQCFLTPDDRIVFIEINPRFGGGVPLSIEAGADSPRWILELLLGREPAIDMNGWTDKLMMLRYDAAVFALPEDLPTI